MYLDPIERKSRIKRALKIRSYFPEGFDLSCDALHKTEKTPFVAIILFKTSGRLMCLGSIIDQLHILSSKNCYERIDVRDLRVLVGHYKAWWGRFSQILTVKRIIRHEYVLCLLRLHDKIRYTMYIKAVKLPSVVTKMELEITKIYGPPYQVIGFPVDRYDVPGDYIDKEEIYHMEDDDFKDFDQCKVNYSKLVLDPPKLFCVLGNASYCWGGWGGPVLKMMGDYYLQVGVVVADNCTSDTRGPFLVARTDVYGEWIRANAYHGHQPT